MCVFFSKTELFGEALRLKGMMCAVWQMSIRWMLHLPWKQWGCEGDRRSNKVRLYYIIVVIEKEIKNIVYSKQSILCFSHSFSNKVISISKPFKRMPDKLSTVNPPLFTDSVRPFKWVITKCQNEGGPPFLCLHLPQPSQLFFLLSTLHSCPTLFQVHLSPLMSFSSPTSLAASPIYRDFCYLREPHLKCRGNSRGALKRNVRF